MESIHHAIFKSLIILLLIAIFNVCSTSVQAGFDPDTEILHNSSASGWSGGSMIVLHLLVQDSQGLRFVGINLTFISTPKEKIQWIQIWTVGHTLMYCAQADDTISKLLVEQVDGFTCSVR